MNEGNGVNQKGAIELKWIEMRWDELRWNEIETGKIDWKEVKNQQTHSANK